MKSVTVKLTGHTLDEPVRVLREGDTYYLVIDADDCEGGKVKYHYSFEVISIDV